MGQYHKLANLDKRELLHPHQLGCGLKLWEQIAAGEAGIGQALLVLLASASNGQGGGDLKPDPVLGRWRGDRIVMVGDYDDATEYDVATVEDAIAHREGRSAQRTGHFVTMTGAEIYGAADQMEDAEANDGWLDVSLLAARVLERELDGKFVGDGWREWRSTEAEVVIIGSSAS